MRKEGNFWVAQNGNKWSRELWSEDEAIRDSVTLQNCTNCTNCSDCKNCSDCISCHGCENCKDCNSCILCKDCTDCEACVRLEQQNNYEFNAKKQLVSKHYIF